MSSTGCYLLHVFCDDAAHKRTDNAHGEFTGANASDAWSHALNAGWRRRSINGKQTVICSRCLQRSSPTTPTTGAAE